MPGNDASWHLAVAVAVAVAAIVIHMSIFQMRQNTTQYKDGRTSVQMLIAAILKRFAHHHLYLSPMLIAIV